MKRERPSSRPAAEAGADPASSSRIDTAASRVLYIGRVPHGFYEAQMRGFFSQFGVVTRLRISRNKKTGHSKHYAFLEFETPEVAAIVADSMHNYLVAGHILQARLMPVSRQHPSLWKGANRKFQPVPRQRIAREQHNRVLSTRDAARRLERQLKREEVRRRKLEEAGIEYDFPGLREKLPKTTTHIVFGEGDLETNSKADKKRVKAVQGKH